MVQGLGLRRSAVPDSLLWFHPSTYMVGCQNSGRVLGPCTAEPRQSRVPELGPYFNNPRSLRGRRPVPVMALLRDCKHRTRRPVGLTSHQILFNQYFQLCFMPTIS